MTRRLLIQIFIITECLFFFPILTGSVNPYARFFVWIVMPFIHILSCFLFFIGLQIYKQGKSKWYAYALTFGFYFLLNIPMIAILLHDLS